MIIAKSEDMNISRKVKKEFNVTIILIAISYALFLILPATTLYKPLFSYGFIFNLMFLQIGHMPFYIVGITVSVASALIAAGLSGVIVLYVKFRKAEDIPDESKFVILKRLRLFKGLRIAGAILLILITTIYTIFIHIIPTPP